MERRAKDDDRQAHRRRVRHQQPDLHGQPRRLPGMQGEVQKVEAGVGDRVAEQRTRDARNTTATTSPATQLRDQKREGRVMMRRDDAGARAGAAIRSRRAAGVTSRERGTCGEQKVERRDAATARAAVTRKAHPEKTAASDQSAGDAARMMIARDHDHAHTSAPAA